MQVRVVLVGDHHPKVIAHQAIPVALLFQPERLALEHINSLLVDAFVQAATAFSDA